MESMEHVQVKLILMGDSAVGKTALRRRYLGEGFSSEYIATIGADFAHKRAQIGNTEIHFQIWDLAGQQQFSAVRSYYYKGALGGLLLFDVTRPTTLLNAENWVSEYWKHNGKGRIPFVLLGNKVDLRDQSASSVSDEDALGFCKRKSELTREAGYDVRYLPTSAKTGLNVEKAFETVGLSYLKFVEKHQ